MRSKNNNRKKVIYAAIILVVVTIGYFFFSPKSDANRDSSEGSDSGQEYTTTEVLRRDITQSVTATGVINPEVGAEVNVGAQVSGIVQHLYVEIGSKVRRNQLLAVIDPGVYQAKEDEALAQKDDAAVEEKYAQQDAQRDSLLFRQHAITKQQLDADSQKFEVANAKLKQAQADYEYAKLQLGYTRIFSPIDGVVAAVATQEGETVAASFTAPTFVTVINLDKLELWAYVDETDIGKVKDGQRVTFYVDTYPGESLEGVVKTIHPDAVVQNNVVNYVVVVTIGNHKRLVLRPQMDATISIYTEYKKDVMAVPKRAVQFDDSGKKYVSLLVNGKIEKRFVTTGISDERYYEVLSGLSRGMKVVLN